jgi:hypothetical protein
MNSLDLLELAKNLQGRPDERWYVLKLPGDSVRTRQARRGFPGKVISFYIVSLDPAHSAWLSGHAPVKE